MCLSLRRLLLPHPAPLKSHIFTTQSLEKSRKGFHSEARPPGGHARTDTRTLSWSFLVRLCGSCTLRSQTPRSGGPPDLRSSLSLIFCGYVLTSGCPECHRRSSSASPFVYLQTSHSLLSTFLLISPGSLISTFFSQPVSSQFWQMFSIIFSAHLPPYFWPHTSTPFPTSPSPRPLPPPLSSSVSDFLQSFSSSFRAACFVQCSEVMAEYNGPPSRKKREQFVPVAASEDSRDQGCDLYGPDRTRTHAHARTHGRTHTHTHKAMMMRPFPLSSPDPHLTANEKHDNYPQLFSPRPSAAVIEGLI